MLYTNRRGSGQECAFWWSHRYVSSLGGVIPEKPLIIGPPMGITSLNVYAPISAQDKHITTPDSSICASRQDTQCAIVKTEKWGSLQGSNLQKFVSKANLQPNLKSQPKMSNNFLTVHTRRKTSMDHQQKTDTAESIGDIKIRLWHHLATKTTSGLILQG
jgi:hypothetical protein